LALEGDLPSDRVIVIAEAGVNHNGSPEMALRLVDAAAETGADLVKFQTFKTEALVTASSPKADYQNRNAPESKSQFEMLKALELDRAAHEALIARCKEKGIGFLSTPFDPDSVDLLTRALGLKLVKVSSGDLTNAPLLLQLARSGADLIVSTGMATLDEVEDALSVLAFGFTETAEPSAAAFKRAYAGKAAREMLAKKITLLHCTSDYPAKLDDINLRAMDTLAERFGIPVGYSDHSVGIAVSIAAAARGATVIEKHFTLDRTLPGPDHKASLEPAEFKQMVDAIRAVSLSLGIATKAPSNAELSTRKVARKAIVAARPIRSGEAFSFDNLTVKRAGEGLAPIRLWEMVGRTARRAYAADEAIEA
jgi:N-acetylneuraminate synthase